LFLDALLGNFSVSQQRDLYCEGVVNLLQKSDQATSLKLISLLYDNIPSEIFANANSGDMPTAEADDLAVRLYMGKGDDPDLMPEAICSQIVPRILTRIFAISECALNEITLDTATVLCYLDLSVKVMRCEAGALRLVQGQTWMTAVIGALTKASVSNSPCVRWLTVHRPDLLL
jgi:hypothetical protein